MASETTTKFKVDISELKKGIQEATRQIRLANAEFKAASAGMDDWANSADGLSAKVGSLQKVLKAQKEILEDYKKQLSLIVTEYGENSKEADEMRIKIANQQATVTKTEKSIEEYEAALKKLDDTQEETSDSADDLDESLEDVADSAKKAGEGGFSVLKGALSNLVADGIKLALDGLKKLGEAIIDVGKKSVANYAEYEQLVGGVETLFKDSAKQVQEYANKAYKTAGLSANEYMETVTSFSASLLQGLNGDTATAAKIADLAITDMSDNANKMGTSMESLQNAYGGLAKQNFQMLDNLRIGYQGTAEEMARLINDSGVMGDTFEATAENVKEISFDKYIEAIHKVQTEMGITGTTAKEAASTIEGSKGAMQASWQNLLTGLADENANLDDLWGTFMGSAETYIGNMYPRIQQLVSNVLDFIKKEIQNRAPDVWQSIEKAADILSKIFKWIVDNGKAIVGVIASIGAAFAAWKIVSFISNLGKLVTVFKGMWLVLAANPVGLVVSAIAALVAGFIYLWNTSEDFRKFWLNLWDNIKTGFASFLDAWGVGMDAIKQFFENAWDAIKKAFKAAADFLLEYFKPVINFYKAAWNIIKEVAEGCWKIIRIAAEKCWTAIKSAWGVVSSWFNKTVFEPVSKVFSVMWDKMKTGASAAWEGIKQVFGHVSDWFKDTFSAAWQKVKDVFSTGGRVFEGIKDGIVEAFKVVVNAIIRGINNVISIPFNAINGILDNLQNVSIAGIQPFENLVSRLPVPQIPELEKGGILKRGQVGLLEGNGAEAVVPLDKNSRWISATAAALRRALGAEGMIGGTAGNAASYTFNQYNTSPKALSRIDIYRQSKNLLALSGVK